MYLSITIGKGASEIYDKQDNFNFEIFNFPFLDGDAPRSPYYVGSNVSDFTNRYQQGHQYNKIRKAFPKFYHRQLVDCYILYC